MRKRVLLIGRTMGFMMNAIINGLKKEGYEVEEIPADVNQMSRIEELPGLIVLYLDAELAADTEFLVYLKDLVSEKECVLFVVGTDEEIEEVRRTLPEEILAAKLNRPLNVRDLAGALDKEVARGTAALAQKKILIIDDDPTMLRMIKNLLSSRYRVYMANSGMNGITFLAGNKVDLILLDYEMPIISGAKVLEMIRCDAATQDIPVMFLTSKNDRETVMQVLSLKPERYLLKTMPPEEWLQNINDFFGKN